METWEQSSLRETERGDMVFIIIEGDRVWSHGVHNNLGGAECGSMGAIIL